jgi:hypothetical protein
MAVEVLASKSYDCHQCDDNLKLERGCETRGRVPSYLGDEPIYRCPLQLISPLSYEYIRAFALFQKHFLPNGVAWNHEAKKFLDAMVVLENTKLNLENREIEEKGKKHGRHRPPHSA